MKVIIVGAGAAGLMAANHLSAEGVEIIVLEARERIGGRIYTLPEEMFSFPAEAGAEFVHGHVEVTAAIAKEASVPLNEMLGAFWKVENGRWKQDEVFIENEELLLKALEKLKHDESIATFLERKFGDTQFDSMRQSILAYVEGYDAADTKKASAFAFREEWKNEEDVQFRPEGGYEKIIRYLNNKSVRQGAIIQLDAIVSEVNWQKNKVTVSLKDGKQLTADKLIFTIPLGVWQSGTRDAGFIQLNPSLPEKSDAFRKMGYGSVIKIILKFAEPFWKAKDLEQRVGQEIGDLGFLISDQVFPTWWTTFPIDSPLLTGWMAGPKAQFRKNIQDKELVDEALASLSKIFKTDVGILYQMLNKYFIFNWTADPYALGGYSYSTVNSAEARKTASAAVENTLFFAGEAFYQGTEMGTVEAAFASGLQTAKQLIEASE